MDTHNWWPAGCRLWIKDGCLLAAGCNLLDDGRKCLVPVQGRKLQSPVPCRPPGVRLGGAWFLYTSLEGLKKEEAAAAAYYPDARRGSRQKENRREKKNPGCGTKFNFLNLIMGYSWRWSLFLSPYLLGVGKYHDLGNILWETLGDAQLPLD